MKIHNIKILEKYAGDVLRRKKTFEIRYNDRAYSVGDIIIFNVVDNERCTPKQHPLNNFLWLITYILDDDFNDGLRNGYVAMSIKGLNGDGEVLSQIAEELQADNERRLNE